MREVCLFSSVLVREGCGSQSQVILPLFFCEVRDSRAKGGNVGLDMIDLGSSWVVF